MEKSIYKYVTLLNNEEMKIKLEIDEDQVTIVDFIAKEVRYHSMCRVEYQRKAELRSTKKPTSTWHNSRDTHDTAFHQICQFVNEKIINGDEAYLMKYLTSHYHSVLSDINTSAAKDVIFTTQHLQDKLFKHFGEKIKIDQGNKKRGNIIYNASMNSDVAARKAFDSDRQLQFKIRDIAFDLRKEILNLEKRKLPQNVEWKHIYEGEADSPDLLSQFFKHLIVGPATSRLQSKTKDESNQ